MDGDTTEYAERLNKLRDIGYAIEGYPDYYKPTITLEKQGEVFNYEADAENHFVSLLNEFKRCVNENDKENKYEEILNQSRLLSELKALS